MRGLTLQRRDVNPRRNLFKVLLNFNYFYLSFDSENSPVDKLFTGLKAHADFSYTARTLS